MPQSEFNAALIEALDEKSWAATARPNQRPPDGDWTTWLLLAGRGFGKTRAGAEYIIDLVSTGQASRVALVAATAADVRDVMVEGSSGIIACSPDWNRPVYEPSKRRLTWRNGATATTFSADESDRLRGPEHDAAWCDELASWRHPASWDMLMFGLRLGARPRVVVTTTPRPTKLIRDLVAREGLDVAVTRGSSYENRANLAPQFFEQITKKYENTRLGRQELMAELLLDVPGALWTMDRIEELRRTEAPTLARIVIAVDPSGSGNEEADECGIVAAGVDHDGHGWVLVDGSGRYPPTEWAKHAVALYHRLHADRIVAETNFGGGMVEATIRAIDPNVAYRSVTASRGKVARAEPVAALYEQSRVHHLGGFPELEDQMTSFSSSFDRARAGFSPGRVDALVWAVMDLMIEPMAGFGIYDYYRRQAAGLPVVTPAMESLVDNRTDWRRRHDEMSVAPTPNHPDIRGGATEWVNGPLCLLPRPPDPKIALIAEERARFAELSKNGRMPTSDDAREHATRIDAIQRGRA